MPRGHYERRPRVSLTGDQFGDWTVIGWGPPLGAAGRRRIVRCVCGTVSEVRSDQLRAGRSKGCGCKREARRLVHSTKHGMSKTPEYAIWSAMRQRCTNPAVKRYPHYGGRGIKVCDRWLDFAAFIEDVGRRPSDDLSLDRIDNNGDYEPGNVRWATTVQQNNNTRRNVRRD